MRKALSISWVTVIEVTFDFSVRLMINSSITELITGSRPIEGSSKRISSGSSTNARASPTRFFIPPLNSDGSRSFESFIPTRSSLSSTILSISLRDLSVSSSSGRATLSRTVRELSSAEY